MRRYYVIEEVSQRNARDAGDLRRFWFDRVGGNSSGARAELR